MVKKYLDGVLRHKNALIFVAGMATAIIGKKLLGSEEVRDTAVKGMAGIMSVKKEAEDTFQDMKEDAEDIVVDANAETKEEIYETEDEE